MSSDAERERLRPFPPVSNGRCSRRPQRTAADVLGRRVIVSQERVPEVPRLDDDDVRARFREAAAEVLSTAAVERVVTLVADLPEPTDCSELFELFASAPCHGVPEA
ncbi:hypothetical protein OHB07_28655 [Streptomyces sp. NBC_00111]|uniref:hypothetical protein n=1 Tax=unclassified Streptomyces TaxID=2593676 RepID=UPI002E34AA3C|nr:hypothetical protein [Streptomyces sp. NBC_01460]